MKPKSRTVDGLLHLRYNSPHQIHTTKIYPLSSSNGSSVIVSGHERGVTFTWRGGRPFKANGGKQQPRQDEDGDHMMASDSESDGDGDDDEEDVREFEKEEEEYDPSQPYRPIVQQKDLELGTAVLHIAFPPLPQSEQHIKVPLSPPLLEEKVVVALACADSSIRLLLVPLDPPSPGRENPKLWKSDFKEWYEVRADWIDTMVPVPRIRGHTRVPQGISVAFAPRSATRSIEGDGKVDIDDAENVSIEWDVVIVSYSGDLTGKMLIHKMPVSADGMDVLAPSSDEVLWQSQRLRAPVVSAQIYVSPSSAQLQIPRILVAEKNGPVRIFECATDDSDYGAWGLTLHPGYNASKSLLQPRIVLDAQWVLGGKAVVVLMADGEWGIWEISSPQFLKTISGSIPTNFTLSGWISGTAPKLVKSISKPIQRSSLVPMTPGTRKVRQEALFSGPSTPEGTALAGGICVNITNQSISGKEDDETLLLWHGEKSLLLPSLSAHWRSKFKGANDPFSAGPGSQLRELSPVDMRGELRTNVAVFPAEVSSSILRTKHADVLVSGERGFTIIASPLKEPEKPDATSHANAVALPIADDELLARGELDVGGLDRMLDMMGSGALQDGSPEPSKRRRVGFAT